MTGPAVGGGPCVRSSEPGAVRSARLRHSPDGTSTSWDNGPSTIIAWDKEIDDDEELQKEVTAEKALDKAIEAAEKRGMKKAKKK